jgi:hypothetical protein
MPSLLIPVMSKHLTNQKKTVVITIHFLTLSRNNVQQSLRHGLTSCHLTLHHMMTRTITISITTAAYFLDPPSGSTSGSTSSIQIRTKMCLADCALPNVKGLTFMSPTRDGKEFNKNPTMSEADPISKRLLPSVSCSSTKHCRQFDMKFESWKSDICETCFPLHCIVLMLIESRALMSNTSQQSRRYYLSTL